MKIEDVYPLSPLQEGMYYHWAREGASYVEQMCFQLQGAVNVTALENSYRLLVKRHAILRTSFTQDYGEELLQVVKKEVPSSFFYKEVSSIAGFDIKAFKQEDRERGFDLHKDSQMRLTVLHTGNDIYDFIWTQHHILMDGWCIGILINEFFQLYYAQLEGRTPLLSKAYPYAGYIKWLMKKDKEEALDYWRQYLSGYDGLATIPGRQKDTVEYTPRKMLFSLDKQVSDHIRQLCSEAGVTENIFIQAVWGLLLCRYNNTDDVVFGAVVSGRPPQVPGVESIVGLFINTVPVRVQIDRQTTGRVLLRAVQQAFIGGTEHHYTQLARIQAESGGGRELLDHILVFENYPVEDMVASQMKQQGALTLLSSEVSERTNYDFSIVVAPGESFTMKLAYNGDVYSEQQVNNVRQHFTQLIGALVSAPDSAVDTLSFISEEEKKSLLEFSFSDTHYSSDTTITALFEAQVLRSPDQVAVVAGNTSLTYAALQQQARQLAACLRKEYGVQPGDVVAIRLERNEKLLIAILGILMAGGAYVPVDPEYPQERVEHMLSDSHCKLAIDQQWYDQYTERKTVYEGITVPVVNQPSDLAYVIYTSGSTGKPKGVMITHQSLVDYTNGLLAATNIGDCKSFGLVSTIAADLGNTVLYPSLLTGGTLHLFTAAEAMSPESMQHVQIDCLKIVPSHWKLLLLLPAKCLIFGGEQLTGDVIRTVTQLGGSCQIYNHYGPSETTIGKLIKPVSFAEDKGNLALGKPFCQGAVYILDKKQQLVPVGVEGEICISGTGVAAGYLHQPELTATRFMADPYRTGESMYRTGDLGVRQPDGNILFAGRVDDQVKIRGYRIELGEIEKTLLDYAGTQHAAVVVRTAENGERELVAWVVNDEELQAAALRAFLLRSLPEYMIPVTFIQTDKLPVTLNGKLDRRALAASKEEGVGSGFTYVAPRNSTEEKLVMIWEKILNKTDVGVLHDFFALGGHSLKLIRLSSEIHREFNVRPSLKDLYAHPVVEQQALLIRQAAGNGFVAIPAAPVQESYVLSSSQRRMWMLSQFETSNIAYNMPGVFVFTGKLDTVALDYIFALLVNRHEILRTVFREDETGEIRQFILPDIRFGISSEDLRVQPESVLQERIEDTSLTPFDLSEGPLLRAGLYQVEEEKWIFTFAMHHIISDGWSVEVLVRELMQFYHAFVNGSANPLPPLQIQYKDYAVWQQNLLNAPGFKQHAAYWQEQFSGELPVLQLTTDKIRPAVKTYNGGVIKKHFSIKDLKAFCQEQGATLFMGLLATVNALLYRYTGQNDIIIGSPVAGREHADLEDQIGFYVNTLALRTRMNVAAGFTTLLQHIKQLTLDAYDNQIYPFDELVDALQLQRDVSRSPLFDVVLVVKHPAVSSPVQGELQLSTYPADDTSPAKFDLLFDFTEEGEEMILSLSYNSDLFYAATVERLADHLLSVLSAGLAAPDEPLSTLSYLSTAEQQQLLTAFNDTQVPYPSHSTIHELFEVQVKATPDRTALHFEEQTLSYQQLNERANQVAHYLHEQYHLQPDELVGLQVERREWLLIAILGILKAGAAYVPLDMDYPKERLAHMLADSNCKLLLDESWLQSYKAEISAQPQTDLPGRASADSLAYVMYTSGSTGVPKGVMVCHRSVVRLVRPGSFATLDGSEILLSTGAVSFDATTFEYWGMLLNGGSLVLSRREVLLDTQQLGGLIRAKAVNMMWFTAGWLNQLVEEDIHLFSGLKTILAGGDKLSADHIRLLQQLYPDVRIINGYGPTENTTFSLTYEIPANGDILIGRPINNSTAYILDSARQLVPVGVEGEICVGGDGLGRGYLNNAVLTAEKFIPHPFRSGERLYRTGDLGRLLPDGNIVFAGRLDAQVKIRGYRIEPGEIEHLLQQHEGIDGAIVLAKSNGGQDKELVAYLTGALIPEVSVLRDYLKQYLPDYMLPAYYVPLASFPLTANGKVDRRLLPDTGNAVATTVYIAPRNETEEKMTAIWEEILSRSPIGIQDNFFELGGHSLKVTKMLSRINSAFQVKINIRDVFKEPTIAGVSEHIRFIHDQQKLRQNKEGLIEIEL